MHIYYSNLCYNFFFSVFYLCKALDLCVQDYITLIFIPIVEVFYDFTFKVLILFVCFTNVQYVLMNDNFFLKF